jgi:hypothetical protein
VASFRLERPDLFAEGSVVKAYAAAGFHAGSPGAVAAQATVSGGVADLTGLVSGVEYVAVGGEHTVAFSPGAEEELPVLFGSGDLLGAAVSVPPEAHILDVRDGTAASPALIGVSASYSRTDATTRAELNAMGPEGTDGPDGATILRAAIKGAPASQVQISSVVAEAWQTGAYEGTGADACPIQSKARTSGGATGRAIGAYLEANREAAGGGQQGLEIRVKNSSGASDSYVSGAPSKSMGIWLNASSAGEANSAAAIQIGHGFSRSFDVGLAANASSVATAFLRDDSSSAISLDIRGTHASAAIQIGSQAGPLVFNNPSGNFKLQQAFNPGDYLTGTAAGDGVILTGAKTVHIGQGAGAAILRVGGAAAGIGFFGTTPTAKPTVSGAKGSNAALGSLLAALAAYGLVTDSTSA